MEKATVVIEKGMGGSFLLMSAAEILRKLVSARLSILNADKQELLAFLSSQQSGEYTPASGNIEGILKQTKWLPIRSSHLALRSIAP